MTYATTGEPGADELLFLPLGGCNEIGINANVYGHDGKWLLVDLGIGFTSDFYPGTDVIMPDMQFLAERKEDLVGIVATHAHEDHIGAIPFLWHDLQCPIFASPFTAHMIHHKLVEAGLVGDAKIHIIQAGEQMRLGPFDLSYFTLTHSKSEHFVNKQM
ncbi:MAG: MBL fold metallo-hydrolase [Pseudomonadota bacterium]